MSTASHEGPRRTLTGRRPETVVKLLDAAVAEIAERGYDALTVRLVATRAGVSTASAYSYFAGKDHLLTEVFWRRLALLPEPVVDPGTPVRERIQAAVAPVALLVAQERELAAGVTTALLAHDPDVRVLREQIGGVFAARIGLALGTCPPEAAFGLTMAFVGALLSAGMGQLDYGDIPTLMGSFAALLAVPA